MYKNIGKLIRGFAIALLVIGFIIALISVGFLILFSEIFSFYDLLYILLGAFLLWGMCVIIYGFGVIVEKSCCIDHRTQEIEKKLDKNTIK